MFMGFISIRAASITALAILTSVVLFHVLVVSGIVPKTIVWGGRISDPAQVVRAEIVSIMILLVTAAIVAMRWRSLAQGAPNVVAAVGTWVLVGLFALNTVGNLFAKTLFERAVFTPLTLLLALLMLRLALERVAPHA
jgi:hypothetical protein